MRGEDQERCACSRTAGETPPHAWGRRHRHGMSDGNNGNTPTCVGKTMLNWVAQKLYKKHPHMRGEDAFVHPADVVTTETPPHAWGRLLLEVQN